MKRWRTVLFVIVTTCACMQQEAIAMIFRPEKGAMWDPSVLWHNSQYQAPFWTLGVKKWDFPLWVKRPGLNLG